MFNRQRMDPLKLKGGVVRSNSVNGTNTVVAGGTPATGEIKQETASPIRVYKPARQQVGGPLSKLEQGFSFYDLIMERPEAFCQCIEDWVLPEIVEFNGIKHIKPLLNISHEEDGAYGRMNRLTTQYIFIPLNSALSPVQSFGEYPGPILNRTQYLVCVNVGDIRVKKLDKAYIEYVIPLNAFCADIFKLAAVERNPDNPISPRFDPAVEEVFHYYKIDSSAYRELEERIFTRWFESDDYFFNAIIYPKAQTYSDQ